MTTTPPVLKVGDPVIYIDPLGNDRPALVTAVWSPTYINVVFVSGDESRTDQYGRQIERETSVTYQGVPGVVKGRLFRGVDEVKIVFADQQPQQV